MTDAIPDTWFTCIERTMAAFDTQRRAWWQPKLQRNEAIILGLFADWSNIEVEVVLTPLWTDTVPEFLWPMVSSGHILNTLACCVGAARGAGDERLTPQSGAGPRFELIGMGFVVSEQNPTLNLHSSSFYLHDRIGGFYTRRFMGRSAADAEVTRGVIPVELTEDEAWRRAMDEQNFYDHHMLLSRLLFACLEDPRECAEAFGANLYGETMDLFRDTIAKLDPLNPRNPIRAN